MLIRFGREISSLRKGETFEKLLFFIDLKSAENECKSITGWRTIEEKKSIKMFNFLIS